MASKRGPRGWKKRVKRVLLNVLSLGRVCTAVLEAEDALSADPESRSRGRNAAILRENELLKEELRLKDMRMFRVPGRRRPHYSPTDRMAILEIRAARGWSTGESAQRFHVSEATIASWLRKSDDLDSERLLKLREPVNKFPDLVRLAVRRLKAMCPRLGKDKIAEMFCRAGVEISSSTVSRIVKEPAPAAPPPAAKQALVRAKSANEAWLIDLTAVPIGGFGFWISWLPFSVPLCWPFCYWVGAVVDMYSRRALGIAVFRREPSSARIRSFLQRVADCVGRRPRFLISDHDPVFKCSAMREWCGRVTRQRFGAVGQKGSIAIVERFFLTLKSEFTRQIFVTLRANAFRREARFFLEWFNGLRPHAALGGRTPQEIYEGRQEENIAADNNVLAISFYKGRRHLPVVSTRRAAA